MGRTGGVFALASAGLFLGLAGCTPGGTPDAGALEPEDAGIDECFFSEEPVEPMELDGVIAAYSWPEGLDADGNSFNIDLETVPCATDDTIDWSPFEVLLFVSIPAW